VVLVPREKLYLGAEQPKVHPTGPVVAKAGIEVLENTLEIMNTINMKEKSGKEFTSIGYLQ
jgi:hypothetical protein